MIKDFFLKVIRAIDLIIALPYLVIFTIIKIFKEDEDETEQDWESQDQ